MEGWKSYLADPAPGNALIKKDNPNMTDEQLTHSVAKLKEMGIITGGDAPRLGIGMMNEARLKAKPGAGFVVGVSGAVIICHENQLSQPALRACYSSSSTLTSAILPSSSKTNFKSNRCSPSAAL